MRTEHNELVDAAIERVETDGQKYTGNGELANAVFEELTLAFGLPWKKTGIGDVPDWTNPLVRALNRGAKPHLTILQKHSQK